MRQQGIVLTTYAERADTPEHRRQVYVLEERARVAQPFRRVGAYIPTPYPQWEIEFSRRDPTGIFLAVAPVTEAVVGVVTGLEWYFTGTHPEWCGRGIAMALKVRCLQEARARGLVDMETENHEDNVAMLAINRKLGFVLTGSEVACIKELG